MRKSVLLLALVLGLVALPQAQTTDRATVPEKYKYDLAPIYPTVDAWRAAGRRHQADVTAWNRRLATAGERAQAFKTALSGDLPANFAAELAAYKAKLSADKPKWATRKSSQMALEVFNPLVPDLLGGSADLTGSNNTKTSGMQAIVPGDYHGRYIHYGIREHGMAAAMNGLALHGGIIPYGGTFLVFTDYCRPAIRLSALMRQRVIYVMTHDSIGLGEDGPTHQPVEHLAALRAIPNLAVFRPADAVETAECWALALEAKDHPSILALSRQDLPLLRVEHTADNPCRRGAYELRPAADGGKAQVTLLATGSEVEIAVAAQALLQADGVTARVVSVPCMELFAAQDAGYRQQVLQPDSVRVAVEAGIEMGWERLIGERGAFIGMHSFGASGPAPQLYKHFGITAEAVAKAAKDRL